MGHKCDGCREDNAHHKCSNCSKVWYCSKTCQTTSWWRHKFDCAPEKVTTADILYQACMRNVLPEDEETLEDFRFRDTAPEDYDMLLGLYQSLTRELGVNAATLNRWRKDGRLSREIRSKFESVPPAQRGDYWGRCYPWLIHNQASLEGKDYYPTADRLRDFMLNRAWMYVGGSTAMTLPEIRRTVSTGWDEPRARCLYFCAFTQSDIRPDPEDSVYFLFGYCTCSGDSEGRDLAMRYRNLLQQCTFDELVEAFKQSQLHSLFQSKRVAYSTTVHPFLEELLSRSPSNIPTVWYLKEFVLLKSPQVGNDLFNIRVDFDSIVKGDYGFRNCKNQGEINILKAAYRTFFNDPKMKMNRGVLRLHGACMEGKIYEYLSGVIDLRKNEHLLRRLMKNPYPTGDGSGSPIFSASPLDGSDQL